MRRFTKENQFAVLGDPYRSISELQLKAAAKAQISWLAVVFGISLIVSGFFYSIALRNPGGAPVSAGDSRNAIQLAYVACAIGAFTAIGIPAVLTLFVRTDSPKLDESVAEENE